MKRWCGGWGRCLWAFAVVMFVAGMILLVLPGDAAAAGLAFGDVTFSFGQVCILLAVAAAWGDMRNGVKEVVRRVDRIEKHVFKD